MMIHHKWQGPHSLQPSSHWRRALWKGSPLASSWGCEAFCGVGRAGPCFPGPSVRWTCKQTAPDRTRRDSDEDSEVKHLTRCDAHICWLPSSRGNPQGTLSSISDPGRVDGPVLSTGAENYTCTQGTPGSHFRWA